MEKSTNKKVAYPEPTATFDLKKWEWVDRINDPNCTSDEEKYCVLRLNDGANIAVKGETPAGKRVKVTDGASAILTLNNATVTKPGDTNAALALKGKAKLTLILKDGTTNILVGGSGRAGLEVARDNNVPRLTIDGTGALETTGGKEGAGIGGFKQKSAGFIIIENGTITATGKGSGAGIGGGYNGNGGVAGSEADITINGGNIKAYGGHDSAGIGGGGNGRGAGKIKITGGTVYAKGGGTNNRAACIGTGGTSNKLYSGNADTEIYIEGGVVTVDNLIGRGHNGGGKSDLHFYMRKHDGNILDGMGGVVFTPKIEGTGVDGVNGILFRGTSSEFYGIFASPTESFSLPNGYLLTIPSGKELRIKQGTTFFNEGTIENLGTLNNKGKIVNNNVVNNYNTIIKGDWEGHEPRNCESTIFKPWGDDVSFPGLKKIGDHTWVESINPVDKFACAGGTDKKYPLGEYIVKKCAYNVVDDIREKGGVKIGTGDQIGIAYLIDGVCHQMANRFLLPSQNVMRINDGKPRGYFLSLSLYGWRGEATPSTYNRWYNNTYLPSYKKYCGNGTSSLEADRIDDDSGENYLLKATVELLHQCGIDVAESPIAAKQKAWLKRHGEIMQKYNFTSEDGEVTPPSLTESEVRGLVDEINEEARKMQVALRDKIGVDNYKKLNGGEDAIIEIADYETACKFYLKK